MMGELRVITFGAHPDDCDLKAGGVAHLWARRGAKVKFVSVTNGNSGHHEIGGAPLARRRRAEAQAAGASAGIEYEVLDYDDGGLVPSLEVRYHVVRLIREHKADLVLTHRPNDYHPDHRYTSQVVQDAAYLVTVPNVCSDVPALRKNPVFAYFSDRFKKPYPFTPDVVVDISDVFADKVRMVHCHDSQFYEWLAWHRGDIDEVPATESERLQWLTAQMERRFAPEADLYRSAIISRYGEERGRRVRFIEAFEVCEYGSQPTDEELQELYPF